MRNHIGCIEQLLQSTIGLAASPRYTHKQNAWRPTPWVAWKKPHAAFALRLYTQGQTQLSPGLQVGGGGVGIIIAIVLGILLSVPSARAN